MEGGRGRSLGFGVRWALVLSSTYDYTEQSDSDLQIWGNRTGLKEDHVGRDKAQDMRKLCQMPAERKISGNIENKTTLFFHLFVIFSIFEWFVFVQSCPTWAEICIFFNGCFILFFLFTVCVLYTQGMGNKEWREVSTTIPGHKWNGLYEKPCFYVGREVFTSLGVLHGCSHDHSLIRCVLCWNKYSFM